MRLQDMPRTPSGDIDISFIRKQAFHSKQYGTGEDSISVEFHLNLNSMVNTFATQVIILWSIYQVKRGSHFHS